MPFMVQDADVIHIASEYSIPPAILMGVVRSQGASPTFNMPQATLSAYNLKTSDVNRDPLLGLEVAARTLAQSFSRFGTWEQALSQYLDGDPRAYQSPTSMVGGQVYSILGSAAIDPSFGLSAYQPKDMDVFQLGAGAFGVHLDQMISAGGVVSPQGVSAYRQAAAGVSAAQVGSVPYRSEASTSQAMGDVLTAAGLPVTQANLAFLSTMARGEGMPAETFNWLATTQGHGDQFNSVGVKIFGSYQEGVTATAQTLLNGNYGRIVEMMRSGADLATMAKDAGVQANLRTWQGGSAEDINLMLQTANVPGTPPGGASGGSAPSPTGQQQDKPPDPAVVGEFAAQLQQAHISPQDFIRYFPVLSGQRRKLIEAKGTSVSDFAEIVNALQLRGEQLSEASLVAHVRGEPHPTYPNITVGAFHDAFDQAMLHSVTNMSQIPSNSEAARFAASGAKWKEIHDYYVEKAASQSTTAASVSNSPPPQAQQAQTDDTKQREMDRDRG